MHEKAEAAAKAVEDLRKVDFMKEVKYTTWLSNVFLVKKYNGKWRMCVDYTDLNNVCLKDTFPLLSVHKLVDNVSDFRLLSFMDASGYNQISMYPANQEKTAFLTHKGIYCYRVMSFRLKNVGATYQRMMNKVFKSQIGRILEVCMDGMIVKTKSKVDHIADSMEVFAEMRKHNMRLNPEKCTFEVRTGKFLSFYLTKRGIKANSDK